jgi:hypothetical protein
MNLTDVYRIFHSTAAEYTFFTAAHKNFSKLITSLGTMQASANIRKWE